MKKTLLTVSVLLALAIAACEKTNTETNFVNTENIYTHWDSTKLIDQQTALEMVINQINLFNDGGEAITKSNNYELLSAEIINPLTKSENNSPMFLFNFKDQRGYALISADKRDGNTIYFISTNGNMSSETLNDKSSPYHFIYKCINNYQNSILSKHIETPQTKASGDEELVITRNVYSNGPFLKMTWEQQAPFNQTLRAKKQIPMNSTVGCAPVAIGQIFAYITQRDSIFSLAYDNTTFNMKIIHDVINANNVKGNADSTEIKINEVSNLLYYIG